MENLPEEILAEEIFPYLSPALKFVASKVCKLFYRLIKVPVLFENPLSEFACHDWAQLIRWDQRGPAPSLIESRELWEFALEHGSIRVLKYLCSIGRRPSEKCLMNAICRRQVDLVKFLVEISERYGFFQTLPVLLDEAARSGSRAIVEYFLSFPQINAKSFGPYFVAYVAEFGDVAFLKKVI